MSEPFADNWSYLRAELAWLDRVLMRASAKQQQTQRDVARVAHRPGDQATSHWWQGLLMGDPSQGGSLPPAPVMHNHPLGRFGEKIALNLSQKIPLAIPLLCERLDLGQFERNVLLLCLAPEISRRYEKIYHFLNGDGQNQPTVDLCLRLFCHSDHQWRECRQVFTSKAPLIKRQIIQMEAPINSSSRTLLGQILILPEKTATYCLNDDVPLSTIVPKTRQKAKVAKTMPAANL
ncbi:MAG: hypothetical protein WCO45_08155 [Pseudanabaena sp. ELA607]|jgi:hypothetical protein